MSRAVNRCPNCREPVSPFAAGCAICGADLEAARARLAARRGPSMPSIPSIRLELDWLQIAVAIVLALALPPLAFVLSLYWAIQANRAGRSWMVATMLLAAALSLAAFLAPVWFWSHLL